MPSGDARPLDHRLIHSLIPGRCTLSADNFLFDRTEQELLSLLPLFTAAGCDDVETKARSLAVVIEFVVCGFLDREDRCRGLWCDGVTFLDGSLESGILTLDGLAWCANHRLQWQVPISARFILSYGESNQLESMNCRLGDRGIGSLRHHLGARRSYNPDEWTVEFNVSRS